MGKFQIFFLISVLQRIHWTQISDNTNKKFWHVNRIVLYFRAKYMFVEAASLSTARKTFPDKEYPGKEYHIQRVVDAIFQEEKEKIEKEEILLLDDDMNNVTAAIDGGHRSMQVQVKEKDIDYDSLDSFERMLRIAG